MILDEFQTYHWLPAWNHCHFLGYYTGQNQPEVYHPSRKMGPIYLKVNDTGSDSRKKKVLKTVEEPSSASLYCF